MIDMRSNRCVRFIENRDDIKINRNRYKIRIHIKIGIEINGISI